MDLIETLTTPLRRFADFELVCSFQVGGTPATAGSKRAFIPKGHSKPIITDDCKRGKEWRATVRAAATMQNKPSELAKGPLVLAVEFRLSRPASHYGTGRNAGKLKSSAPTFPLKKPDTTKLLRAIEDALTGIVWEKDEQIVGQVIGKVYANPPGARVSVYAMSAV